MANFDTGWKYISEYFFQKMVTFFFTDVSHEIDWEKGYSFLEKELLSLQKENEVGNKVADKLVKVYKLNGEEAWVLIHLEFQEKKESHFSARMFE
jgi:hypothetical protein